MAEPWQEYAAQPPAAGPWQAFGQQGQDEPREGGLAQTIPQAAEALSTPEGRGRLMQGVLQEFPVIHDVAAAKGEMAKRWAILSHVVGMFTDIAKSQFEAKTPEEEAAAGLNAAMLTMGGGTEFGAGHPVVKAVAPVVKSFDDGVITPAAQRLDSYARTGDPNGVRLEPPAPEVKPEPIRPIEGSPFAGAPRSVAAKTGVPEVDSVLNSPVTKAVIDNPVVDRSHDIPYMAGASEPMNNPTVFIDKHVPREQTIGGVTFDPADPWTVHENVEQHTMDILTKATEPLVKGFQDTRNQGVRFHGSPSELGDLDEFHYGNSTNYYGAQGFYTSDALDVANGYMRKSENGAIYKVTEKGQPKIYDMEAPIADVVQSKIKELSEEKYGSTAELTEAALDEKPSNLREFFDAVRGYAASERIPADEVQEGIFHPIMDELAKNGYAGMEHIGGLKTKVPQHNVKIYFNPKESLSLEKVGPEELARFRTPRQLMTDEEAYRVAHFNFAEPAEQAWYRAHGIDQVEAEKEQATWLPKIQGEATGGDVPESLYKKPYPHDHVPNIDHEPVTETKPTPEETARGFEIIRNAPELQPKSAQPMLAEARELGVIGEQDPRSLNQLPPKEAGQRAMAANGPPPDKVTGEVGGAPEQTAWRKRWERTLDKMQTPADARALISQAVEANDEFMPARQGDMSAGQVEQLASVAGLDSAKIDVAGTSAKIKTNAEIRNTIEAFRGITDKIQEAAKQLAEKHGVGDEAEAIELTRLELQRDLLLNATTSSKEFAALRAEFGRIGNTIQDFMAASRETNAWREFLKDKQGRTIDDVRERARMIADAPPDALPKILEATRGPQKPGWLFWSWQQGLISGLITHTKYLMVNTATVYLERVISPEVAAIMGKMRGDKVSLMAPLWANVGMVKGLGDAFSAAGEAFKTGLRVPLESEIELTRRGEENPELRAAKTPYGQTTGPDWGIWKRVFNEDQLASAAKVLSIPGKSANMIHTFYKVLSERGAAASRAYEAAFAEGATGDRFSERYDYHLANPTDEALKATVDDAYSGAFMEKLGDRSGTLAKALASNPVTKWLFPFQHIPWNIERMTVNYSPAALFELLGDTRTASALKGDLGHPAQNLAMAKIVVGTSIIGYFVDKALSGVATPDYPQDPKERRRWQLLNMQPNSVQVGDQWVEMTRLGPVGNVARIGANLGAIIRNYDGKDDSGLMKAIWAGAMAAVNQVGDETGFQTLRNIIDVIDGKQPPGRFLAWQAGSFMPFSSFLSQNASIIDPDMRKANDLVSALKYRLPMERETLPPKRDALYGEPVANPGYHTFMRESPVQTDPAKLELARLGYYPTAPQKQIGHVKLTDEQYDRYEATAGPLVKQMLNAAIRTPHYQTMLDVGREQMLKGVIEAGRARARQAMQMWYPKELIDDPRAARKAQITGATP